MQCAGSSSLGVASQQSSFSIMLCSRVTSRMSAFDRCLTVCTVLAVPLCWLSAPAVPSAAEYSAVVAAGRHIWRQHSRMRSRQRHTGRH